MFQVGASHEGDVEKSWRGAEKQGGRGLAGWMCVCRVCHGLQKLIVGVILYSNRKNCGLSWPRRRRLLMPLSVHTMAIQKRLPFISLPAPHRIENRKSEIKIQGFHDPTPIQKRVLPKAILGRKDIIGAAETGSGKTLAYGLPLLSEILARRDAVAVSAAAREIDAGVLTRGEADAGDGDADDGHRVGMDGEKKEQQGLQALVLCPTRELALQVAAHLREVVGGTGLAVVVSLEVWENARRNKDYHDRRLHEQETK